MNPTERFIKMLTVVADLSNFRLSEEILVLYTKHLEPYGLDIAAEALEVMTRAIRPGKPFPSVNDILEVMGEGARTPEDESREAAARIIGALSKYGWCNPEPARKYMGELAWRVVELMGGWGRISDLVTPNNTATLQAQFRDLARSQVHKVHREERDLLGSGDKSQINRGLRLIGDDWEDP